MKDGDKMQKHEKSEKNIVDREWTITHHKPQYDNKSPYGIASELRRDEEKKETL